MQEYFSKCEPIFTISTTAKSLGISVQTFRMYERESLIIPFKKTSSRQIISKQNSEIIQYLQNTISDFKISINGIKEIYSLIPCPFIRDLINKMKREN